LQRQVGALEELLSQKTQQHARDEHEEEALRCQMERSRACTEAMIEMQNCLAAQLAGFYARHREECSAFSNVESELLERLEHEIAHANLERTEIMQQLQQTVNAEQEEAGVARQAIRSEVMSARGQRRALREELRAELETELSNKFRVALTEEVREELYKEVQGDPCSNVRRQLCRDLRQELRDQLRSELRSELHGEGQAYSDGSQSARLSNSLVSRRHRINAQHSPGVVSPSTIGATSSSFGVLSPPELSSTSDAPQYLKAQSVSNEVAHCTVVHPLEPSSAAGMGIGTH